MPSDLTVGYRPARPTWFLFAALLAIGASWGVTMPMSKLAVSTGHSPQGIIPWQFAVVIIVLGAVAILRRIALPWTSQAIGYYVVIAVIGTILPNSFSYMAAAELPAGIMSIIIATVPMFSLLIALPMANEQFQWRRLFGLMLGASALVLLVGPEASLPDPSKASFILVALIAPFFYGLEGNYIARFGRPEIHPVAVLLGASIIGFAVTTPMSIILGLAINPLTVWGQAEWGIVASSVGHAIAYVGYVWLVGAAGVVFTAQVAYVVTASGVILSGLILGETYSAWVWFALALMLAGIGLVQPRPIEAR